MPKNFLAINLALIFFAFPFAISGIAVYFQRLGSLPEYVKYGLGFSGIVWAFTGLLLFLLFFVLIIELFVPCDFSGKEGLHDLRKNIALVLFLFSFGVMSLFFLILNDVGTDNNPYAHFAGFALGFIIPGLISLYLDLEKPIQKASCILAVFGILTVSSCAWLFI